MTDDGTSAAGRADLERRAAVQAEYLRYQLDELRETPALWRRFRLLQSVVAAAIL